MRRPDNEKWLTKAASTLKTTKAALYKQRQRMLERIRAMKSNGGSLVPDIRLTYEQAMDIADRGATYVLIKLNEWEWHKLDVAKHGSVADAIWALRLATEKEACRTNSILAKTKPKKGQPAITADVQAERDKVLADIKNRYDLAFHIDRMRICPVPRLGWIQLIVRFGGAK